MPIHIMVLLGAMALVPAQAQAQTDSGLLQNLEAEGILSDGGKFEGTLSITSLNYENGQLLVSGILEGTVETVGGIETTTSQTFENVSATLSSNDGVCDILFLNIGPIFLDVLGLQVDLSEIELDIDAVAGEGNLLGNLLCAVAGLLDPGNDGLLDGLGDLVDTLLNNLVELINNLLG